MPRPVGTRILIPAVGKPYSMRGLEIAYRLARELNGLVQLAYVLEVPRAYALDALVPDADEMAQTALTVAQRAAQPFKVRTEARVQRTRNAQEAILTLLTQQNIDLLVLATRADEERGLPKDLTRELFRRATCEVVVDYVPSDAPDTALNR